MKYAIGQIVAIKNNLRTDRDYRMRNGEHPNVVTDSMLKCGGQLAVIESACEYGYRLKDLGTWTWTDEMLELNNLCTIKRLAEIKRDEETENLLSTFSHIRPLSKSIMQFYRRRGNRG